MPGDTFLSYYTGCISEREALPTDAQTGTQAVPRTPALCLAVGEAIIKFVSADMQPGIWGQGEDIAFVLGSAVEIFK